MSGLPPTWSRVPLSEISSVPEQRVPGSSERFRYIDIASIDRERKAIRETQDLVGENAPSRARKVVRTGDVLVSMTRPNLNAVAIVPPELDGHIASTGFDVLRPKGVDPRWLYYLVRSKAFVDEMSGLVQGALYPAVRSKDVRAFMAPVAPLAEQKRIADKLDRLLAAVDSCKARLDAIPAILKRFRQSVLAAATSGVLTEAWRADAGHAGAWHADFPIVPLMELLQEPLRNGRSVQDGEGARVLRLTSLKGNFIDLSENKSGRWSVDEARPFFVRAGDFLISRGNGSLHLVGRGALVQDNPGEIAFPDTLIRARPNQQKISPSYLGLVWASEPVRRQIELAAKTTAGIWKVNQPSLEAIRLPVPPLREQQEIVHRAELLLAIAAGIAARMTEANSLVERLGQCILAKAFRGELVPQNSSDQSVEPLLQAMGDRTEPDDSMPGVEIHRPLTIGTDSAVRGRTTKKKMHAEEYVAKTLDDLLRLINEAGGELEPAALLKAARLEENPELFFELLRQARDSQLLDIPIGASGVIRGTKHAAG